MIIYVSAGNSDDKLSQYLWAHFTSEIEASLEEHGKLHGAWFSRPDSEFQNACWCVEFDNPGEASYCHGFLTGLRDTYRQDSIAWTRVEETEFI